MKLYRDFTAQEAIDLEYNLALLVPDMGSWIEWYSLESATVSQELDCVFDVRYGPTMDKTVDVFPAGKPGAPALVYIHGGYWLYGSSKECGFVARGLVLRDFTVVVVNHSLCPKVTIAEITRQNRAVIAWLRWEARRLNADSERLFVAGASAGGHQVGMLAITDWPDEYGLPDDVVNGAIAINGIFDLRPLRYSFLQPKLLLTHELIRYQSPYLNIPGSGPPLMVVFDQEESGEFRRQSTDFLQAWCANGLQGKLLELGGKHHFSAIAGFKNQDSPICNAVVDFIARCETK